MEIQETDSMGEDNFQDLPPATIEMEPIPTGTNSVGSDELSRSEMSISPSITAPASPVSPPKITPRSVVKVRNAVKRYGTSHPILNNFSMTVQKGTIYSLLGSSGCGKTTLLSCVVGIKNLNCGEVLVFGANPGTKESGIPGKRVGYMPQETALYYEFTIAESLRYFGTLYGMSADEIIAAVDFLVDLLDLPDATRRIGTLSGGQKRRVSLAASLVHGPELLILDEPTVGVDPLLRESIWNHLVKLASSQNTTVIITTHYIEEARQSNTIGLMRGGRLLTEQSPAELLKQYNTNLLEDIVLKLCKNDAIETGGVVNGAYQGTEELDNVVSNVSQKQNSSKDSNRRRSMTEEIQDAMDISLVSSQHRIKALVIKNLVMMTRNFLLLVFTVITPAMVVAVVCLSVGNDPKLMKLGFVNQDIPSNESCPNPWIFNPGCDVQNLACQFLAKVPTDKLVLRKYETEDAAVKDVQSGKLWGIVLFPKDYSNSVYARSTDGTSISNQTIEGSQIRVRIDMTNKQITGTIKRILFDAYKDFLREMLSGCGFNSQLGELPIQYTEPIYGMLDTNFKEYIAPSIVIAMMLFFPLCMSGVTHIKENKQGTLERSMVAGVQTWEIMTTFLITETCILIIQAVLTFLVVLSVFEITNHGSVILAVAMCILVGYVGVSTGFLIGSFCTEEIEACLVAIALIFPCFCLTGTIWPIEGMPVGVQYFSYTLPLTFSGESIRSIVSRGWGLTHDRVWPGFVSVFVWIIFAWCGTIINHRLVSRRK